VLPGEAQNLNQKYGPGWDCGSITATPQYEGEYRACKKCEAIDQDFYRTSDSSGYCVPKGDGGSVGRSADTRTEEPAESNLPAVIPITPKSGISTKDYFGHPFDTESTLSSEEALEKAQSEANGETIADVFIAQADKNFRAQDWAGAAMGYYEAADRTKQKEKREYAERMAEISHCHDTVDWLSGLADLHKPDLKEVMEDFQKCTKYDFAKPLMKKIGDIY
jgi:hypothetical protein